MRIDILTVLPEIFESPLGCSILKRAADKGLVEYAIHNIRDYTTDRHHKVDDYPFGGEAGMVMKIEPVDRCISALKEQRHYDDVIFTTPDGEILNQSVANTLSLDFIGCSCCWWLSRRERNALFLRRSATSKYAVNWF